MKKYCSSCGALSIVEAIKPIKFCGQCGEPFDAAFKKAAEAKKVVNKKPIKEEVEEDNGLEDIEESSIDGEDIQSLKRKAKQAAARVKTYVAGYGKTDDLKNMGSPIVRPAFNPNSLPPEVN